VPLIGGAELSYFNIKDPSGTNDVKLTFTNYMSLNKKKERVDGPNVKRAVIVIHGLNRDPGT
jgi:hypothetical protein